MQKFSSILILMFAVIFWVIRIIGTYYSQMGVEFMVQPLDFSLELVVLFTSVLCFILIAKRKWLGVILYLVAHGGYFGAYILDNFSKTTDGSMSMMQGTNMFFSFIGILLPIVVLIDMIFDKNRELNPSDKKTDWFYKDKKFDRDLDERVDKNNYRTL